MEWQIVFAWFPRGAKEPRQINSLWVKAETRREALAKARAIIVRSHPAPEATDELELSVFSAIGPRDRVAALALAAVKKADHEQVQS